jgi:hypothetical protein
MKKQKRILSLRKKSIAKLGMPTILGGDQDTLHCGSILDNCTSDVQITTCTSGTVVRSSPESPCTDDDTSIFGNCEDTTKGSGAEVTG